MFKNATPIVIKPVDDLDLEALASALPFSPCGPTESLAMGFVPPRGEHQAMVERVGDGHDLLMLRVQKKAVPASAVRREVDRMTADWQRQNGIKPPRSFRKDWKDQAFMALLPKAFPTDVNIPVLIRSDSTMIILGTASSSAIDAATSMLMGRVFKAACSLYLWTNQSVATGLQSWALEGGIGEDFTTEKNCALSAEGKRCTVIKNFVEDLSTEVKRQFMLGMRVESIHAIHRSGLECSLSDRFQLRALDFPFDEEAGSDAESAFDGTAAIESMTLFQAIDDIVNALGGTRPLEAEDVPA